MTSDNFEQFCIEKGFAKKTEDLYKSAVKAYETFNNCTLDELLEEADLEEEKGIRWKRRTIKMRLTNFRKWLFENKSEGTAKQYFARIKTIYRHFEIELQELPTYNSKQVDKTYEKRFEDIPCKDELIQAYYEARNNMKCFILLASSSGMSKVDILNLTVSDFLIACETNTENSIREQLNEIRTRKEPVIPCFKGERQKTKTIFTTFCSPETVEHIVQYLLGRDAKIRAKYEKASMEDKEELPCRLELYDSLLKIDPHYVMKQFREINTKLSFGTVGKYAKIRSHQLRAYHATTLMNCEVNWSIAEIDALQGRKKDKTHRAYFTDSVSKLRKKYCESVDSLMLFKSIKFDPQKYDELKQKNKRYHDELVKYEEKSKEQEKMIKEIIANQRELEALLGV